MIGRLPLHLSAGAALAGALAVAACDMSVLEPVSATTEAAPSSSDGSEGAIANVLPDAGKAPTVGPTAASFDWRDAVAYAIVVDRFRDGDPSLNAACNVAGVSGGAASSANYQGGDWAGIAQKIVEGYFTSLGVNALVLTMPVWSAKLAELGVAGDSHSYSGYHGYWPTELDEPEGCFGTLAGLQALVVAAHAKGIKVVLDWSAANSHAASSVYAKNSGWFFSNDNGRGGNCLCGDGCAWDVSLDRRRCWFTSYLPRWDYTVAAARDYSIGMTLKWLTDTGVDGLRIDDVRYVDDSWLAQLRTAVDATPVAKSSGRFYLLGDTFDFADRASLKARVDPKARLDGQLDFPLRKHLVESVLTRQEPLSQLAAFMSDNEGFYGADALMTTWLGSHVLPRVIHLAETTPLFSSTAGGNERAWNDQPSLPTEPAAFERLANAFAILLTNPGVPLIYYGDEVGLAGAGDPDNRRPMPWSGLSAEQTWLRDRISKLTAIRATHPALRRGHRVTLSADSESWLFSQSLDGNTVYVAVNRGDFPTQVTSLPPGPFTDLVTGDSLVGPVLVAARQTRILVK